MLSNNLTIQSYELGASEYVAGTAAQVSDSIKAWIEAILTHLDSNARILEIGSAFGRDAAFIESFGFTVERTDAAEAFVSQLGSYARKFNVLSDEFSGTYDLIFANAVFLHFTREELKSVLSKIKASLNQSGILAFSVKKGEGEEWTREKIGHPRYFCYWSLEGIQNLLEQTGFQVISISEDDKFLQIISRR